jgi:hypothetical protein
LQGVWQKVLFFEKGIADDNMLEAGVQSGIQRATWLAPGRLDILKTSLYCVK